VKIIKDIENHLDCWDASYDRFIKIEAIEEKSRKHERIFKTGVGIISIICALYAIYQ
jgi:hypothetical protein